MAVDFNFLDVIFLLLILAGAVRGTLKGFVSEMATVSSLVLGIWGAIVLSSYLGPQVEKYIGPSAWNRLIAFLISFLVIYILVKLVELLLHRLLEGLSLQKLDQVLGFFLGIAEGILVTGLIVYLLRWQPLFDTRQLLADSLVARLIEPLILSLTPDRAAEALKPNV